MAEERYILFIVSETAPTGACDGWFWLNTVNKKLFRYQGYANGSWVEKPLNVPVAALFPEDVTFEKDISARDVQVVRNLIADDKEGITQVVKLYDVTKLKFKKGILYEVE